MQCYRLRPFGTGKRGTLFARKEGRIDYAFLPGTQHLNVHITSNREVSCASTIRTRTTNHHVEAVGRQPYRVCNFRV